jgi:hypothetical protein
MVKLFVENLRAYQAGEALRGEVDFNRGIESTADLNIGQNLWEQSFPQGVSLLLKG